MKTVVCPPYGKHQCFLGATGSGKSVIAMSMIDNYKYVIIDTQESIVKEDATYYKDPRDVIKNLRKKRHIIYRPAYEFKTKAIWDWFFHALNDSSINRPGKLHPLVIYIDEIYQIGYGRTIPNSIPQGLATCRQRKISYWVASQRPFNIPIPVLSESTYIYIFVLSREDDKKYIAGFGCNKAELFQAINTLTKEQHNFILSDPTTGKFEIMPPIKI